MELQEKISEIKEKETPESLITYSSILKYEIEFDSLSISLNEEESTIHFKLKNIIEPFYWENSFTHDDLKNLHKNWYRFYDIFEIFLIYDQIIKDKKLKFTRLDESLCVEFKANFLNNFFEFKIHLKPQNNKEINNIMADFGKIILKHQNLIDIAIKSQKNLEIFQDNKLSIVKKELNERINEENEKNSQKIQESNKNITEFEQKTIINNEKLSNELKILDGIIKKQENLIVEKINKIKEEKEIIKLIFLNSQLNITNTSFMQYGNNQTFKVNHKGCYIKWVLEMKNIYSNSYNFFHKIRLYITGPQTLYIPDENYPIYHEWFQYTYNQYSNQRETGFFELDNEGTYTIQFQGMSSSGNYMYVTNPTLFLEIIKK